MILYWVALDATVTSALYVAGVQPRVFGKRAGRSGTPDAPPTTLAAIHADPAVEFSEVTRRYGQRTALDAVTFSVGTGSVLGVLGPNGAGKSTLLSTLCGLQEPDGGAVRWFGRNERVPLPKALRRRLGVVTQDTALYGELTVRQNLRFAADLYRVPSAAHAVEHAAGLLSVSHRLDDAVGELSGGNQRRVAIARALIHDPDLLVFDEPTLGVDIETRHAIWSYVRQLRNRRKTIVVSTNYLDEALALCDRVILLRNGRLMSEGTPDEILERTGRCVEIDCAAEAAETIVASLEGLEDIAAVNVAETVLTVRLTGNGDANRVVETALTSRHVEGFRVRAPDLLEVFQSLADTAA
ncbi:MAG TPA: ABC transporter ATP-binding protein [Acidimicrobiales bacterium]|nr:ABC transporter ATP-binding protein [Acidimicrobiales bacterium]